MMLHTIAVFTILVPIAVYCTVDCDEDNPCYDRSLERMLGYVEGFPDAEVLDHYCRPAMDYITCRRNFYYRNCSVREPAGISESTYNNILELLSLLCQNSSEIRRNYLENVNCYNKFYHEAKYNCSSNVFLLEWQFRRTANVSGATSRTMACLFLPHLKKCFLRGMEQKCGEQGIESLDEITNRILRIFTDYQCLADDMNIWQDDFNKFLENLPSDLDYSALNAEYFDLNSEYSEGMN